MTGRRALAVLFLLFASASSASAQALLCETYVDVRYGLQRPGDRSPDREIEAYITALKSELSTAERPFCEMYEIGRAFILLDRFSDAIEILDTIDLAPNSDFLCCNPLLNLIGFAYLELKDYERAAEQFEKQVDLPEFERLDVEYRMKVFNNLGYVLIQLGRYDESLKFLRKAALLGSQNAAFNIMKVESIVGALQEQNVNAPGAFATIVDTSRDRSKNSAMQKDLAGKIAVKPDEIRIFKSQADKFFFAYGAYLSYPAAEDRRDRAQQAGLEDAWITLMTEWEEVSTPPSQ